MDEAEKNHDHLEALIYADWCDDRGWTARAEELRDPKRRWG